jgi:hypothetical protein
MHAFQGTWAAGTALLTKLNQQQQPQYMTTHAFNAQAQDLGGPRDQQKQQHMGPSQLPALAALMSPGTAAVVVGLEQQLGHLQQKYLQQQQEVGQGQQQVGQGQLQHEQDQQEQQQADMQEDAQQQLHQFRQQAAAQAASQGASKAAAWEVTVSEQQQRLQHVPLHSRAFEALVAAAAATEEAEAVAGPLDVVQDAQQQQQLPHRPPAKRQCRGKLQQVAAAAAAAADLPPADAGQVLDQGVHAEQAEADAAAAAAAVAAVEAATAAAVEQQYLPLDPAAVVDAAKLADAVTAALAAAAAGQAMAAAHGAAPHVDPAAAAAAGVQGLDMGYDLHQAAAAYGSLTACYSSGQHDSSWNDSSSAGMGMLQDYEPGDQSGGAQQLPANPVRAMKKRLAASESYKRKKDKELHLSMYSTQLKVCVCVFERWWCGPQCVLHAQQLVLSLRPAWAWVLPSRQGAGAHVACS